jgi:hypothetical protein
MTLAQAVGADEPAKFIQVLPNILILQKIHFAILGDYASWFSEPKITSEEPSTY